MQAVKKIPGGNAVEFRVHLLSDVVKCRARPPDMVGGGRGVMAIVTLVIDVLVDFGNVCFADASSHGGSSDITGVFGIEVFADLRGLRINFSQPGVPQFPV